MNSAILLIFYILVNTTSGAKILLWPWSYNSHARSLSQIGENLSKNGHEIHLILSETMPQISEYRQNKHYTVLEYKAKYKDLHQILADGELSEDLFKAIATTNPATDIRQNSPGILEMCKNELEDETLMGKLKHGKYDLAITDGFPLSRCHYITLYRFGIPYVSFSVIYEPWLMRTPALPSFVPFMLQLPIPTSDMTFLERLINTYALAEWSAFPQIPYVSDDLIRTYAPDMPFVTNDWLAGRSLLWLLDTDITIDFARPRMPNEINVGGLSTRPSKPLSMDLQKLMNSSKSGVILVSFGTVSALAKQYWEILLQALGQVEQKVILRYLLDPPKHVPSNVKIFKWVPQNDVLGHPNLKLFITHAGANSQFEALYHGVPMLNIPIFGDQHYNAKRSDYKGYSLTSPLSNLTVDGLVSNIKKLLSNDCYRNNVKKGSMIFKSNKMHPRQRAAYWIEHVLQFGGDHLHSHALDMNWYEYLMLDLLLFIWIVLVIFLSCCFVCIKKIVNMCCVKKMKTKQE